MIETGIDVIAKGAVEHAKDVAQDAVQQVQQLAGKTPKKLGAELAAYVKLGFKAVKIVASSGFGPAKCRVMAEAKAPIDVFGTGSFLPSNWTETYATADIVEYDGHKRVKIGREFLHRVRDGNATQPL